MVLLTESAALIIDNSLIIRQCLSQRCIVQVISDRDNDERMIKQMTDNQHGAIVCLAYI
jgi:hypothetical protein